MDNYVDERDQKLLESDRYTYFVMGRVMKGKCDLILSDHEKLILCYTGHPFPVWIWTPDGASEEGMERAYLLAKENSFVDGKYHFNVKYELADYFIRRAKADGIDYSVTTNMFAYDCPEPVAPSCPADGQIYQCVSEDVEELVWFIAAMHEEVIDYQKDMSVYRNDAREYIATGKMFFWKDDKGKNVACCKYAANGDLASINLVFTRPEHRRKHYAQNLVYQVTMKAKQEGYMPMLYTDADYQASNACYEKIGYVLRGKLCTIG